LFYYLKGLNVKNKKSSTSNSDAVFIGWQKRPSGDAFPLYIVTAEGHPYYRSSVSEKTLIGLNLKYEKQNSSRRRENNPDRPAKRPDK
jgi:hypothetical protein